MSSIGTTTSRSNVFVDRRLHDGDRPAAGEERRDLVDRTDGGRQPDALRRAASSSASSRSRVSARCAPRLVAQTAWTSSTITVSTPRSASRAAEVSSRNSDSGVVIRMSAGRRANSAALVGRRVAGAHRHRDVGLGQVEPGRGLADAGQRRAQVALDVDGQRLERADVEHPAAAHRVVGHGSAASRSSADRNAASVLPAPVGATTRVCSPRAIASHAPCLGRRRRGERAVEPGLGGGGEAGHARPVCPRVRQRWPLQPASATEPAGRRQGRAGGRARPASRRRSSRTGRCRATSRRARIRCLRSTPSRVAPSRAIASCERRCRCRCARRPAPRRASSKA